MKSQTKESGSTVHIAVIVILVVAVLGLLGFVFWQNFVNKTSSQSANSDTVKQIDETEQGEGYIVGSLTYPAGGFPLESINVVAVNIATNKEYSSPEYFTGSEYMYGTGFKLTAPVGRYYVYGILKEGYGVSSGDMDKKAYYNEFMKCGVDVSCKDLTKIEVVVEKDKTTESILVGDWWN